MELSDEIIINAQKDLVYAALNNVEILQKCIPGCEELIKHSDTELEAKVVLKLGPVKARFSGCIELNSSGAPDEAAGRRDTQKGVRTSHLPLMMAKPFCAMPQMQQLEVKLHNWAVDWSKVVQRNWLQSFLRPLLT